MCLLAGLTGCLGEEPETEEAASEIVGGTVTTARPEVGQYMHNAGSCTATLIGPQVIITAAHCLVPEYTATQPPAGSVFAFTDIGGTNRVYTVDRVHSFATRRFERPFPGSVLTTDVAIAHLQFAVPASQAVPAALATQEPAIGQLSSIFGFGCTSRDPRVTDGLKRVFSFSFGTQSRALCWGDSGGPVLFGGATGGALWGVNSDFDWTFPNWPTNSWLDMFGNVPIVKKQIDDVARGWNAGLEAGMDRFGFDYAVDGAATAGACKTICERDGNCRAFTWRQSDGACWRKSVASEPTPGTGLTSGLPARNEVAIDRVGNDIQSLVSPNPDSCAGTCARNASCQAWTWLANTCFLKGGIPAASTGCPGCTSGVPRRGQEQHTDRPGFTFQTVGNVISAFDCSNLCARNSKCEAYSHQGFTCSLKDAVPNATGVTFTTSGVRRGVETSSDRPGATFQSFQTSELSPTVCQAACASNTACRAWSYTPPTTATPNALCQLKSAVSARVTSAGMVSGVSGLEFLP